MNLNKQNKYKKQTSELDQKSNLEFKHVSSLLKNERLPIAKTLISKNTVKIDETSSQKQSKLNQSTRLKDFGKNLMRQSYTSEPKRITPNSVINTQREYQINNQDQLKINQRPNTTIISETNNQPISRFENLPSIDPSFSFNQRNSIPIQSYNDSKVEDQPKISSRKQQFTMRSMDACEISTNYALNESSLKASIVRDLTPNQKKRHVEDESILFSTLLLPENHECYHKNCDLIAKALQTAKAKRLCNELVLPIKKFDPKINTLQLFKELKDNLTANEKKMLKDNNVIEGYQGLCEFNKPTQAEFNLDDCIDYSRDKKQDTADTEAMLKDIKKELAIWSANQE